MFHQRIDEISDNILKRKLPWERVARDKNRLQQNIFTYRPIHGGKRDDMMLHVDCSYKIFHQNRNQTQTLVDHKRSKKKIVLPITVL